MSRVWVAIKRAWKIFAFACGCIVLTVCIFMIWRVCSMGTPKSIDTISKNDALSDLYADQGESLYMFKQNQDIITRADYNAGYFSIPDYVFIPDANQLQLVFRYNNSTLKYLARDKGMSEVPSREGDYFDVSLVLYIDLTPENTEDNEKVDSPNVRKIRCKGSVTAKDKTALYNFYRYTFDFSDCDCEEPIDIKDLMAGDSLIAVHAQFYYNEGLDYSEPPYGALLLYDPAEKNSTVKLTSDDIKALSE